MPYLAQKEVYSLLRKYKIPYLHTHLCKDVDEALSAAKADGYPVVMKIESPDIVHKSDAGGVVTGIQSAQHLQKSYTQMMQNVRKKFPSAKIRGVRLQKQVSGKEVIIGVKRDPVFGPVILFGAGGIFVEVLKDVSFRIAPIGLHEAKAMIDEIKLSPILYGVRGEKPVSIAKLQDLLVKVSALSVKEKSVMEMDLNPVIVDGAAAMAVDARIMVR